MFSQNGNIHFMEMNSKKFTYHKLYSLLQIYAISNYDPDIFWNET